MKLKYKRVHISKKNSYFLTDKEQEKMAIIWKYLRKVKSCPISHIYIQVVFGVDPLSISPERRKKLDNSLGTRRYTVKCIIMFLWKLNKIRMKCNNGEKIISISK